MSPRPPIEGYDELGISQILRLLPALERYQLAEVREREMAGAGRAIILRRIDGLIVMMAAPELQPLVIKNEEPLVGGQPAEAAKAALAEAVARATEAKKAAAAAKREATRAAAKLVAAEEAARTAAAVAEQAIAEREAAKDEARAAAVESSAVRKAADRRARVKVPRRTSTVPQWSICGRSPRWSVRTRGGASSICWPRSFGAAQPQPQGFALAMLGGGSALRAGAELRRTQSAGTSPTGLCAVGCSTGIPSAASDRVPRSGVGRLRRREGLGGVEVVRR